MKVLMYWLAVGLLAVMGVGVVAGFLTLAANATEWAVGL